MKELKVGERVTIEAVESFGDSDQCKGCCFEEQLGCYEARWFLGQCCGKNRSDGKDIIFKEIKEQKRKMKENKHSLKISRSCGDITLDGYPIATYSNDELKILKNLLERGLCEVNEYIKD